MINYKLYKDAISHEICSVFKLVDNLQVLSIPLVSDNTDYQAYLNWLAEGGIPEEADDVSSQ